MTRGHRGWLALQCANTSFAAFAGLSRRTSRRSCGVRVRTASESSFDGLPASPRSRPAGRAPRPGPLQGPVHRLRGAPGQARAAAGPHAPLGARRRPGCDRRAGRHREAPEARSTALRPDPGAEEDALAEPDLPRDAPDPGRGEASRVRAGREAAAATRTHREGGARRARGSSSTTGVPSATAVTIRSRTSRSRANATTATSPRSTTAGKPWLDTAVR